VPGPVIVVDDAIAHAQEAFAGLGRVHLVPGVAITGETLAGVGAEALIVRSVTRVGAELLDRAPGLRFVGTATAGMDHLELDLLRERGVAVAHAAGCNALAVAQWVLAALCFVEERLPAEIRRGPVGVVGFGEVGGRVTRLLRALGREVLACDPPLARAGSVAEPLVEPLVEFEELWRRCPIVSFHVPLTHEGPDATYAYLDRDRPAPAGPKLIINTSRGPVVRDRAFARPDLAAAILDVWDGEPRLSPARLADPRVLLASPHVAGYSLEAKVAGTRMMHEALARHLGHAPSWTGAELLPPRTLDGPLEGFAGPREVVGRVVDLTGDDARVRALAALPEDARAPAFETLRRGYRLRREFGAWRVPSARLADPKLRTWLQSAGFCLAEGDPREL
jgi:erythronate-4-phosphate dehydrogenase